MGPVRQCLVIEGLLPLRHAPVSDGRTNLLCSNPFAAPDPSRELRPPLAPFASSTCLVCQRADRTPDTVCESLTVFKCTRLTAGVEVTMPRSIYRAALRRTAAATYLVSSPFRTPSITGRREGQTDEQRPNSLEGQCCD